MAAASATNHVPRLPHCVSWVQQNLSISFQIMPLDRLVNEAGLLCWFSDQTLPVIRDDHRKPLARYGAALGRARSRIAPPSYTTSRTGPRSMPRWRKSFSGNTLLSVNVSMSQLDENLVE
jgi:hypothetical protein